MFQILVVDDDKNTRTLMKLVLEGDNYSVLTACNGEEALAVMDSSHVDLVVLDVMMPEMDGLEVLRSLKEAGLLEEVPVFLITAEAGADGVAAQAAAGRANGMAAQAAAGRADALHGTPAPAKAGARGPWRTYAQGVLTNVLNPKIILFFLALLPQFIAVPNEHGPLPFLALGLTYAALSTAWTVVIVLIAAPFAKLLSRSARAGRVAGVVSGVVYVILGAMILLTE